MAICGSNPIRPEVGQLAFSQILMNTDYQILNTFNKRDTKHLRYGPQLTDCQRTGRLIRLYKGQNIISLQTQFRM